MPHNGAHYYDYMQYSNILLIEDDEDDQEFFLTVLSSLAQAVECIVLGSAAVALNQLTAQEIAPDLIFLDLNMPLMNGQQFLAEIKKTEELKDIPVIILSTTASPSVVRESKNLGALDFITKPNSTSEFTEILRSVLFLIPLRQSIA